MVGGGGFAGWWIVCMYGFAGGRLGGLLEADKGPGVKRGESTLGEDGLRPDGMTRR